MKVATTHTGCHLMTSLSLTHPMGPQALITNAKAAERWDEASGRVAPSTAGFKSTGPQPQP
jgi:hypothetical protein